MPYTEVMPVEQATNEVNALLDSKKIRPKRREAIQSQVDTLIEAVTYGFLAISHEKIVMTLETPITSGATPITEIEMKYRVAPEVLRSGLSRLKSGDMFAQLMNVGLAYVTTPNIVEAVINKLEQSDRAVFDSLSLVFFPQ
jgi:hypothetical protein